MITIYTDGSADNKKRNGGLGVVLLFTDENGTTHTKEHFDGQFIDTTSARMEILAVIEALKLVTIVKQHKIVMYVDNQYVVNTIMKGWLDNWLLHGHEKANMDLWFIFKKQWERHGGYKFIELRWIKGHAGHKYNEIADKLASQGRKMQTTRHDNTDCR